MGFFSQHATNQSKQSTTTVVAQGCTINGDIRLSCDIHVDGYVDGAVVCEKTLVISASGRINGEITADKVIINGLFDGVCYANVVEILQNGKAHGVIHCDDLCIDRGGSFLGESLPTAADKVISISATSGCDKQNEDTTLSIEQQA